MTEAEMDRLYLRALAILEGKEFGHARPILRKLARRHYTPALSMLLDFISDEEGVRLLQQGVRLGDGMCTYNLAIQFLLRGDLGRYRRWLLQAARRDFLDSRNEARRFMTRFPIEAMKRHRRYRPDRD